MALLGRHQGIVRRLIEKGVDEALAIFSTGWLGIDQTRLSGSGACVELLLDDAGGTLYWQGIASERHYAFAGPDVPGVERRLLELNP